MLMIDAEFAGKIPPLTDEEFEQLKDNILAEGKVITPLVVWNGLIVDGHNRYKIIQEHPEVEYTTYEKDFPDRYCALSWICKNQLGRRNLTPQQKKYLIGQRYEAEKMAYGATDGFRGNQHSKVVSGQNDHLPDSGKTRSKIAAETNTSDSYVKRAEKYAQGVDAAEEAVPGIKQEILSGKIHATESEVAEIAKAAPEERKEKTELLRMPKEQRKAVKAPSVMETSESAEHEPDDAELSKPYEVEMESDSDRIEICESEPSVSAIQEHEPSEDQNQEPKNKYQTKAARIEAMRKIGESMIAPTGTMTVKDVLYELNDAAESMIDRWNLCRDMYPDLVASKECRSEIKKLVESTIKYLNSFKGGKSI
ncbi:MAG: hypothetical protein LIO99_08220 [Clostridiales bacterium]|nr:hypothetical protein [Clostridiales bacterium]